MYFFKFSKDLWYNLPPEINRFPASRWNTRHCTENVSKLNRTKRENLKNTISSPEILLLRLLHLGSNFIEHVYYQKIQIQNQCNTSLIFEWHSCCLWEKWLDIIYELAVDHKSLTINLQKAKYVCFSYKINTKPQHSYFLIKHDVDVNKI